MSGNGEKSQPMVEHLMCGSFMQSLKDSQLRRARRSVGNGEVAPPVSPVPDANVGVIRTLLTDTGVDQWMIGLRTDSQDPQGSAHIGKGLQCNIENAIDHAFYEANMQRCSTTVLSSFGQVQAAPTLQTCAVYGYAWLEEPSLPAVDVPFSCEAFTATVLLPTGSKSLEDICENLTAEVLERVFAAVRRFRRVVRVQLPAISAETASDLKPVLVEMGVQQAFTDEAAFQRITSSSPSRVSWVMHRARLDMQANNVQSTVPCVPGNVPAGGVGPFGPMAAAAPSAIPFLVNRPFVLCVRKMDILLLLACIQSVR
ncbi:hypothetical protein HPB50_016957 [Hyalomma asiaticum]|uniref:Uncharacterized protein n=1 Tax=Hyalomma asiaticum TaxID=266040 RepID=A0ACB7T5U3_HYAAI|nr:hypothetical protein HPB50_016957 [Hyalomma asiaticum]